MLNAITKTSNFAGVSSINNETVMYMSASVSSRGEISFSENIIAPKLYAENKTEVDNDLQMFKDEVMA